MLTDQDMRWRLKLISDIKARADQHQYRIDRKRNEKSIWRPMGVLRGLHNAQQWVEDQDPGRLWRPLHARCPDLPRLIRMLRAKVPAPVIAWELGTKPHTIHMIRVANGIRAYEHFHVHPCSQEIRRLAWHGRSQAQIAELMGMTQGLVSLIMSDMRISRRGDPKIPFPTEKMQCLHAQGLTTKEIAKRMHSSRMVIYRRLKAIGLKGNPGRTQMTGKHERLRELVHAGWYGTDIARELGVSTNTIYNHIRKLNARAAHH
jgi:DNA-binding NarL/FixJ family response regulator